METCSTSGKKTVRRYADGGLIGNTVDVIKNRKIAIDAAIEGANSPPPSPQLIAAPPKPSMGSEADNYAAQAASIEAEQQAAAKTRIAAAKPKSFLSKLGFSEGGKIKGPGTPTSDSVAAQVRQTGEPIKVSTDERIVSKAQDNLLQLIAKGVGFKDLDSMLESGTGKPVGPTMKGGKPAAEYGASELDLRKLPNTPIGSQPRPVAPPMNPSMTSVVTGVNRNGNSFSQDMSAAQPVTPTPVSPAVHVPESAPTPTVPVVRDSFGNDMTQTNTMKKQLGIGDIAAGAFPSTAQALRETNQEIASARQGGNYGAMVGQSLRGVVPAVGGLINDTARSAAFVLDPAANALKTLVTGSNEPARTVTRPPIQPGMQERTSLTATLQAMEPSPPVQSIAQGVQERAFQEPSQSLKSRTGNSFTERNTSVSSDPMAKGSFNTIDLAGNNAAMARANAIRQATIDAQPAGGVTVLGDSGRAESQALMDKWGRETQMQEAGRAMERNPRNAQAIAALIGSNQHSETTRRGQDITAGTAMASNETNRRGQDIAAGVASEGHSVTARGQDINARTSANQLAGNPLANELTRTQTAVAQSGLDDKKRNAAMLAEIENPETTPDRRKILTDAVLAAQGKSPNDNRYLMHSLKTYDNGMATGENAAIFDKQTGQMVTQGPQSAMPAPKTEAEMKALPKGSRYTAPDGSVRVKP